MEESHLLAHRRQSPGPHCYTQEGLQSLPVEERGRSEPLFLMVQLPEPLTSTPRNQGEGCLAWAPVVRPDGRVGLCEAHSYTALMGPSPPTGLSILPCKGALRASASKLRFGHRSRQVGLKLSTEDESTPHQGTCSEEMPVFNFATLSEHRFKYTCAPEWGRKLQIHPLERHIF